MTERHSILLPGCTTSPLASYLKGLGILRLVTEQADSTARGCWKGGTFQLTSGLDEHGLRRFLLESYQPTPLISPWNARAGFLEGENAEDSRRKGPITVKMIAASRSVRFAHYRTILVAINKVSVIAYLNDARVVMKALEKKKKEAAKGGSVFTKDDEQRLRAAKADATRYKDQLLLSLRAELDDRFLPWLDACVVLAGGDSLTTPLLGSGGNEGSMDYSINHLIHLSELIDPDSGKATTAAVNNMDNALFGTPNVIAGRGNPGFLNPGVVDGANMSTGYSGSIGDNPWNTVLMLEGAVLFASAITKRSPADDSASLSFPFMFEPLRAGCGSVGASESARPEFWAPVWNQPATLSELTQLLAEGRSTVGARPARNGLDMARAAASLGVDRGVRSFERFGLFERRGKGYYVASPLGSVQVQAGAGSDFISELERDDWLERFRRFAAGDNVARRFLTLRQRLENQLFELAQRRPNPARVQALLVLLGDIQHALAESTKARESLRPVPKLTAPWIAAADDQSSAFRIARALAGLRGVRKQPLPLRSQLFPLHPRWNGWIDATCKNLSNDPACQLRLHAPPGANLLVTLTAILERRLWLAGRLGLDDKPLTSAAGIDLDDLDAFLREPALDTAIAELLPGLALCEIPPSEERGAGEGSAPAAFGLLRLALTPDATLRALGRLRPDQRLPVPPGLIARLASGHPGQAERAVELAWQRLHASGLAPALPRAALPRWAGLDPRRVAAALLIPLNFGASAALVHRQLAADESAQTTNA